MHISIEKGKTLIIRLMAVGPVVDGRAQRDVWFEVNGEVRWTFQDLLLADLPSRYEL
jgi:pyruvate carboxylase